MITENKVPEEHISRWRWWIPLVSDRRISTAHHTLRALWPDTFDGREGQLAAVALIAMVFGIAHLSMGALAAAMAALIGLFLGIIMVVHGSIWPAVVAHGFFDATTFALLPYLHDLRPLH